MKMRIGENSIEFHNENDDEEEEETKKQRNK